MYQKKHIILPALICCLACFQAGFVAAQVQTDTLLLKAEELARQVFFHDQDSGYIKNHSGKIAVRIQNPDVFYIKK